MHGSATNYLAVETAMSGLCNAVLNLAAAFALFHGRDSVPATGPGSLLMDSIGETFLVIALSMSVPTLIARHRRRAGTLPTYADRQTVPSAILISGQLSWPFSSPAFWSFAMRSYSRGSFPIALASVTYSSLRTFYGAVLGSIATLLASLPRPERRAADASKSRLVIARYARPSSRIGGLRIFPPLPPKPLQSRR